MLNQMRVLLFGLFFLFVCGIILFYFILLCFVLSCLFSLFKSLGNKGNNSHTRSRWHLTFSLKVWHLLPNTT